METTGTPLGRLPFVTNARAGRSLRNTHAEPNSKVKANQFWVSLLTEYAWAKPVHGTAQDGPQNQIESKPRVAALPVESDTNN